MRPGTAFKVLIICVVIGTAAIGYVTQKNENWMLKGRWTQLERELRRIQAVNRRYEQLKAELQMPEVIKLRLREHKLDLAPPRPGQVVLMPMEPAGRQHRWVGGSQLSAVSPQP
jgi:hypothetical protein